MKTKADRLEQAAELRRQAEEIGRKKMAQPEDVEAQSPEEIRQTLHELQVHQIELELQNENLRRAYAELDATRVRYFDLYDLSPAGYVTVSQQGLILEANLTAATLLGVVRSTLVQQSLSHFVLPEDQDSYYHHHKQLFEADTPQVWEIRLLKQDAALFWAQVQATVAQDADGASVCRAVITDISERKQAEETLRKSEAKYRGLIENSYDVIYTLTPDGVITFASPSWTVLLGHPVDQVVGKSFQQFIHGDDVERCQLATQALIETGQPQTCIEYRMQHIDGSWRWHRSNGRPVRDKAGTVVACQGVASDITDRKQLEQFRAVADFTHDWEYWLAPDGSLPYVSPSCERLTGYRVEEFQQDPELLIRIVHPADRVRVACHDAIVPQGECHELDYRILTRGGQERWIAHASQPVQDCDGKYLGQRVSNRDITDRKRAETASQAAALYFRNLIESSLDPLATINTEGKITDVNLATEKITGVSREMLIGSDFTVYFTDPEQARAGYIKVFAEGQIVDYPLAIRHTSGVITEVLYNASLYRNEQGEIIGVFAAGRDVTARNQATKAFEDLSARLALAVRAGGVGIWDWDVVRNHLRWDNQMFQLYGTTQDQFSNAYDAWVAGLHPEDAQRGDEEIHSALRGEKEFDTEFRVLWPDGTIRNIRALALVQRDAAGQATHMIGTNWDITEIKRTEQMLRESEANFRTFFQTIGDLIVVATPAGQIQFANQALERQLGYSVEELARMHVLDLHPADNRREAEEIFAAMFRGERECCPLPMARQDGSLVPVETRVWFGRWNGADCIFGVSKDLSEEQESQQRFERLFRSNPNLMALSTLPERQFSDVNDAFLKTLGYSSRDVIGKTAAELGLFPHPEQQATVADSMQAKGHSADFELQVRRRDGAILDGLFSGEVISSQGRQYLLTVMVDITARKRMEAELRNSEERFRAITDYTAGWENWVGTDGKLIWVNPGVLPFTGYSVAECLAMTNFPVPLIDELDHKKVILHFAEAVRGSTANDVEFRIRCKDGSSKWAAVSLQPIYDSRGVHLGHRSSLRDITARKRAEGQLLDLNHQLQAAVAHAQELTVQAEGLTVQAEGLTVQAEAANVAKSRFLANMSHEIRTPLNAVLGFAQLLLRDPRLTLDQQQRVATINRSGEHLLALLNQILELSKIEAGGLSLVASAFDLPFLLHDLELMFRPQTDAKQLTLRMDGLDEVERYLSADELKLRQILMNLLSNAVKFTATGGIWVRASTKPLGTVSGKALAAGEDEPRVLAQDPRLAPYGSPSPSAKQVALAAGWRLVVLVGDSGSGLQVEEIERLFAAFEQAAAGRDSGSGTGLGLAISRQLARRMGGDLTVTSEPGQGCVFRLEILAQPATKSMVADKIEGPRVLRLEQGQPDYRILVVEDGADNREFLVELLGGAGFEVLEATHGLEAVEAFETWQPQLILMDYQLPGLNGDEAIRRIRHSPGGAQVRIIAVTASAVEEIRCQILESGADDFLAKPFRAEELFEKIRLRLGVRYVYAQVAQPDRATVEWLPATIRELLDGLPAELREQLHAAALRGRQQLLRQTLQQVADPELRKQLEQLVAKFDYAPFLQLRK